VVEDAFPQGRPEWEVAGAIFARDVTPFEHMKLRMLNGAHSALAYLGTLAGHETVADAAADPVFAGYLLAFWAEVAPHVPAPPGTSTADYAERLLARFRNTALRHRTWQIAMDGSQKLPQRLLGTVREALAAGRPFPRLALAIAGWMRYVVGLDEQGRAIDVRDPLLPLLREATALGLGEPPGLTRRLLGLSGVFGEDLPRNPLFRDAMERALVALIREGSRQAAARLAL
jgi:fructuronate reductase